MGHIADSSRARATTAAGLGRGFPLRLTIAVAICCGAAASPAWSQSLGDRFKGLFGVKPEPQQAPASPGAAASAPSDLSCPMVSIRSGASTYAVGLPGKAASGTDLRYQVTIGDTARECDYNPETAQIAIRIGIQGRVIVGPAGAPPTVDVPLRVAVVQDGVTPKTIATKAYSIPVEVPSEDGAPYSFVAEGITYPAPQGAAADRYVFYIGFDPQALKPEPKPRAKRKK